MDMWYYVNSLFYIYIRMRVCQTWGQFWNWNWLFKKKWIGIEKFGIGIEMWCYQYTGTIMIQSLLACSSGSIPRLSLVWHSLEIQSFDSLYIYIYIYIYIKYAHWLGHSKWAFNQLKWSGNHDLHPPTVTPPHSIPVIYIEILLFRN